MSAAKPKPHMTAQTQTAKVLEFPTRLSGRSKFESPISIATPSATQVVSWYNSIYTPSVPMLDSVVVVRSKVELEQKFRTLVAEWRRDTAAVSSSTEIFSHAAYQRIMSMGEFAIPFILREFQRKPEHWDYALWMITGENPVSPDDAGRMDKIADAWVRWGRDHRYI